MKPTFLFPCAGHSRRYPGLRPKWLLTTPTGELAIQKAHASLRDHGGRCVIAIKKAHDEAHDAVAVIRAVFGDRLEIVVLEEDTNGPAHTVAETIRRAGVDGPIAIKDADSFFDPVDAPVGDVVACADLRDNLHMSNVGAKSFVTINEQNLITDIVEKDVASNFICCGLYCFNDADAFVRTFEANARSFEGEVFVSHVIKSMLSDNAAFEPLTVSNLIDVGTKADWMRHIRDQSTYVVDIDGVVVRNQSRYWKPRWGETPEYIDENVAVLRALQARGAQLVFMTARPEAYRAATVALLDGAGLATHALVMDCNHGRRYLVNDFAASNPFPSAVAVNLRRNAGDLGLYVHDD